MPHDEKAAGGRDENERSATEIDTDVDIAADADDGGLRVEVERLRALVGPSERSYEAALADADASQAVARRSEEDAGRARGELAELRVELARARHDQDTLQRRRTMTSTEHLVDLGREAWADVVRPALGRLRRWRRR